MDSAVIVHCASFSEACRWPQRFVTLGKSPLASGRADGTVCKRNQLIL